MKKIFVQSSILSLIIFGSFFCEIPLNLKQKNLLNNNNNNNNNNHSDVNVIDTPGNENLYLHNDTNDINWKEEWKNERNPDRIYAPMQLNIYPESIVYDKDLNGGTLNFNVNTYYYGGNGAIAHYSNGNPIDSDINGNVRTNATSYTLHVGLYGSSDFNPYDKNSDHYKNDSIEEQNHGITSNPNKKYYLGQHDEKDIEIASVDFNYKMNKDFNDHYFSSNINDMGYNILFNSNNSFIDPRGDLFPVGPLTKNTIGSEISREQTNGDTFNLSINNINENIKKLNKKINFENLYLFADIYAPNDSIEIFSQERNEMSNSYYSDGMTDNGGNKIEYKYNYGMFGSPLYKTLEKDGFDSQELYSNMYFSPTQDCINNSIIDSSSSAHMLPFTYDHINKANPSDVYSSIGNGDENNNVPFFSLGGYYSDSFNIEYTGNSNTNWAEFKVNTTSNEISSKLSQNEINNMLVPYSVSVYDDNDNLLTTSPYFNTMDGDNKFIVNGIENGMNLTFKINQDFNALRMIEKNNVDNNSLINMNKNNINYIEPIMPNVKSITKNVNDLNINKYVEKVDNIDVTNIKDNSFEINFDAIIPDENQIINVDQYSIIIKDEEIDYKETFYFNKNGKNSILIENLKPNQEYKFTIEAVDLNNNSLTPIENFDITTTNNRGKTISSISISFLFILILLFVIIISILFIIKKKKHV